MGFKKIVLNSAYMLGGLIIAFSPSVCSILNARTATVNGDEYRIEQRHDGAIAVLDDGRYLLDENGDGVADIVKTSGRSAAKASSEDQETFSSFYEAGRKVYSEGGFSIHRD